MILISDLSNSYIKEVSVSETAAVVGGFFDFDSYNLKVSAVDITQVNAASTFSNNVVGTVITNQ
jgi:hypothetical protein